MIMSDPELVAELEEVVGPFFRSLDEITTILEDSENAGMRQSLVYGNPGLWQYVQARNDPDESIEFYEYIVDSIPPDPPPYQPQVRSLAAIYQELVRLDLNGSQRRTLQTATLRSGEHNQLSRRTCDSIGVGVGRNFRGSPQKP